MGLFSWLGDRTGIHSLKPLLEPAAAIGGGLLLGPLGAGLGAGLARTGTGLADHESFGNALTHGAVHGGAAYGLGALKNAFAPSSAAGSEIGPQGGGQALQGASSAAQGTGGMANITAADLPRLAAPALAQGAGGGGLGAMLRGAGSFAEKNPNAIGAGLQGLGAISGMDGQNALRRSQQAQMDYDLQTQRQRDAALEPIRQALAGQLAKLRADKYGIAPNPYAPGG